MDWKMSSPPNYKNFKKYTTTKSNNPFNMWDPYLPCYYSRNEKSNNMQATGEMNYWSHVPSHSSHKTAFISPSKLKTSLPQDNKVFRMVSTVGSLNVEVEAVSLPFICYDMPPGPARSPYSYNSIPDKVIQGFIDEFKSNNKPRESYCMKPHVLNPEAEEYIPKTMREMQESTEPSTSSPCPVRKLMPLERENSLEDLRASCNSLLAGAASPKKSNKKRKKKIQKLKPCHLMSSPMKEKSECILSPDMKLIKNFDVVEECTVRDKRVEKEDGESNPASCRSKCFADFKSSELDEFWLDIARLSRISNPEFRLPLDKKNCDTNNKETQNLTPEVKPDKYSENHGLDVSTNKDDANKVIPNGGIHINGVNEDSSSCDEDSEGEEEKEEIVSDENDSSTDNENTESDGSECSDSDNEDAISESSECSDSDNEDTESESSEYSDSDNSVCFECEDEEDTKFSDNDSFVCFESAEADDSICFEHGSDEEVEEEEDINSSKEGFSICFENGELDDSIIFENEYDNDKDDKEKDEDFKICFEGDKTEESNDSTEEEEEEEEDCDYNCDLFKVEFNNSEWNMLPMSGLVISNIISQSCCQKDGFNDATKNNHFDSFSYNEDASFDDVDCASYFSAVSEEVTEANRKWNKDIDNEWRCGTPLKVKFCDNVIIHSADDWCRKGPWEECARDRMRFRRRIDEAEPILSSVLTFDHRSRVLKERLAKYKA